MPGTAPAISAVLWCASPAHPDAAVDEEDASVLRWLIAKSESSLRAAAASRGLEVQAVVTAFGRVGRRGGAQRLWADDDLVALHHLFDRHRRGGADTCPTWIVCDRFSSRFQFGTTEAECLDRWIDGGLKMVLEVGDGRGDPLAREADDLFFLAVSRVLHERDSRLRSTTAGLRSRGRGLGRPRAPLPVNLLEALLSSGHSDGAILRAVKAAGCEASPTTIRRELRRLRRRDVYLA